MKTLSIAQVTDIHIGGEDEQPHGVDVRTSFRRILADVGVWRPDLLVLSGDLCSERPDREICRWVRGLLDGCGIPYALLAGNHDESGMLAEVFEMDEWLSDGELSYELLPHGVPVMFLDSSSGGVSAPQLERLRDFLSRSQTFRGGRTAGGSLPVVFIHHPPATAGCLCMDRNYALSNADEVRSALRSGPVLPVVFCGHYHAEKSLLVDGLSIFLTPSTSFQIHQDSPGFRIDHTVPGWRRIQIEGTSLRTTVRYLMAQ